MNKVVTAEQLPNLHARELTAHKGDFGRVLLIGGSRGMAGAISLSAMGALRGGAGLVTVATADAVLETVASFHPCYMTVPLECDAQGRILHAALHRIEDHASSASVVAVGPGLGQSDSLIQLIAELYVNTEKPMILDADGINALSASGVSLSERAGDRVLTPHPGEFARLTDRTYRGRDEICDAAIELASASGITVLLKGHRTLVTAGDLNFVNTTGNPGMATGGSGDVLTGLLSAILAGGFKSFEATCMAAYIHGRAGDVAAEERGQISMTALDIVEHLPQAFHDYGQVSRADDTESSL